MVQFSRPGWRAVAVTATVVASLAAVPNAPAAASRDHHPKYGEPRVVASGLDNPRQLDWSYGALYVAEAGKGGSGPCQAGPEGPACYGESGAITRLRNGHQKRVVTKLPSIAGAGGARAIGPSDVLVHGRHFAVSLGLAANPSVRAALPAKGRKLATVSTGRFGKPGLRVLADIGAYEARKNPDGKQIDTNPVALLEGRYKLHVVDAGGNALLDLTRKGIRTRAVFPTVQVGGKPMDAVPTSAAYGPDGAIYVSQLTGFPFPAGAASIWRVVPGKAPTKYATGLTNVTDLAFGKDGSLYAVQLTDKGLLTGSKGSVVRIPAGGGSSHTTVAGNLTAPYGIALHHGAAYVTTCSTCAGTGEILRIPLYRR